MKKKNANSKTTKAQAQPAAVETVTSEKKINPNRENLKALSAQVKVLVDSGEFKTVNAAIIHTIYKNDVHQTFKKFDQWKAEGFRIRKGEKAFCIWGKLTEVKNENDSFEYFPINYIFSNAQVEPVNQN